MLLNHVRPMVLRVLLPFDAPSGECPILAGRRYRSNISHNVFIASLLAIETMPCQEA
jgi:hypothetical protein